MTLAVDGSTWSSLREEVGVTPTANQRKGREGL